jgi:hypothetical protein
MPIGGLHILFEADDNASERVLQTQQRLLIIAHRRGEHPVGSMVRECPLCQSGK